MGRCCVNSHQVLWFSLIGASIIFLHREGVIGWSDEWVDFLAGYGSWHEFRWAETICIWERKRRVEVIRKISIRNLYNLSKLFVQGESERLLSIYFSRAYETQSVDQKTWIREKEMKSWKLKWKEAGCWACSSSHRGLGHDDPYRGKYWRIISTGHACTPELLGTSSPGRDPNLEEKSWYIHVESWWGKK